MGYSIYYLSPDAEKRSSSRFPFFSPIHLKADSGQIVIGSTQNIGANGLRIEISKSLQRETSIMFRFSHEKTSVGGYGRVVWSETGREKKFCGIKILEMKQKDKQILNGILERISSPICPECHSKLDIDKLIPYLGKQFPKERINYENVSPLMEIAYLLNSNLTGEALMEKILEVIKNRFHGNVVNLFLYNEYTRMLELCSHAGLQSIGEFSLDVEKSIDSETFREGEIIFIPDVQKNPSFINKDEAIKEKIHSMIVIPLIAGGKVLGILCLYNPSIDNREVLKEGEKRLLSTFANLIAVGMKIPTSMNFKMSSAL